MREFVKYVSVSHGLLMLLGQRKRSDHLDPAFFF